MVFAVSIKPFIVQGYCFSSCKKKNPKTATTKTKRANKKERLRITDNYASSVLLRKPRNGIVHTAHTNKRVCVGVLTTIKS
jgi:hypothetical protein